jgi:hypothetical protein
MDVSIIRKPVASLLVMQVQSIAFACLFVVIVSEVYQCRGMTRSNISVTNLEVVELVNCTVGTLTIANASLLTIEGSTFAQIIATNVSTIHVQESRVTGFNFSGGDVILRDVFIANAEITSINQDFSDAVVSGGHFIALNFIVLRTRIENCSIDVSGTIASISGTQFVNATLTLRNMQSSCGDVVISSTTVSASAIVLTNVSVHCDVWDGVVWAAVITNVSASNNSLLAIRGSTFQSVAQQTDWHAGTAAGLLLQQVTLADRCVLELSRNEYRLQQNGGFTNALRGLWATNLNFGSFAFLVLEENMNLGVGLSPRMEFDTACSLRLRRGALSGSIACKGEANLHVPLPVSEADLDIAAPSVSVQHGGNIGAATFSISCATIAFLPSTVVAVGGQLRLVGAPSLRLRELAFRSMAEFSTTNADVVALSVTSVDRMIMTFTNVSRTTLDVANLFISNSYVRRVVARVVNGIQFYLATSTVNDSLVTVTNMMFTCDGINIDHAMMHKSTLSFANNCGICSTSSGVAWAMQWQFLILLESMVIINNTSVATDATATPYHSGVAAAVRMDMVTINRSSRICVKDNKFIAVANHAWASVHATFSGQYWSLDPTSSIQFENNSATGVSSTLRISSACRLVFNDLPFDNMIMRCDGVATLEWRCRRAGTIRVESDIRVSVNHSGSLGITGSIAFAAPSVFFGHHLHFGGSLVLENAQQLSETSVDVSSFSATRCFIEQSTVRAADVTLFESGIASVSVVADAILTAAVTARNASLLTRTFVVSRTQFNESHITVTGNTVGLYESAFSASVVTTNGTFGCQGVSLRSVTFSDATFFAMVATQLSCSSQGDNWAMIWSAVRVVNASRISIVNITVWTMALVGTWSSGKVGGVLWQGIQLEASTLCMNGAKITASSGGFDSRVLGSLAGSGITTDANSQILMDDFTIIGPSVQMEFSEGPQFAVLPVAVQLTAPRSSPSLQQGSSKLYCPTNWPQASCPQPTRCSTPDLFQQLTATFPVRETAAAAPPCRDNLDEHHVIFGTVSKTQTRTCTAPLETNSATRLLTWTRSPSRSPKAVISLTAMGFHDTASTTLTTRFLAHQSSKSISLSMEITKRVAVSQTPQLQEAHLVVPQHADPISHHVSAVASAVAVATAAVSAFGLGAPTVSRAGKLLALERLRKCERTQVSEAADVDIVELPFPAKIHVGSSPIADPSKVIGSTIIGVCVCVIGVLSPYLHRMIRGSAPSFGASLSSVMGVALPSYFAPNIVQVALNAIASLQLDVAANSALAITVCVACATTVALAVAAQRARVQAVAAQLIATEPFSGALCDNPAIPTAIGFVCHFGITVDAGRAFPNPWSVAHHVTIETLAAMLLAIAVSVPGCEAKGIVAVGIAFAYFLYVAIVRPYRDRVELFFSVFIGGAQCLAILAAAIYAARPENARLDDLSAVAALFAVYSTLAQPVCLLVVDAIKRIARRYARVKRHAQAAEGPVVDVPLLVITEPRSPPTSRVNPLEHSLEVTL